MTAPGELQRPLDYWRHQLSGVPAVHHLPLDWPRPLQQRFDVRHVAHTVDAACLTELNALARRHDASLFIVLQAAFAVLLSRWSGETDIVIGTPMPKRAPEDEASPQGCNTLVLRTDLSGNPDFDAVLTRVKALVLAAYAHHEVPFQRLADELAPVHSRNHAPLCQVAFTMLDEAESECEIEQSRFDLQLQVTETDDGLQSSWWYAESLFERASIARLSEAFERLLQGIVESPQTPIERLPLLGDADRVLLARWNATARPYPESACIHQLFEAQAARHPDAVAIEFGTERLSYRALNEEANRIAHYLVAQGARPDTLVGLCAERSLDMIVGMLGILKAGAAYLPLDPSYPEDRLAYMLADSGVAIVLAGDEVRQSLRVLDDKTVLPLDAPLRGALLAGYS
ncbi:MAG TPA: condensation domain-containing protein, partial [Lysobacter sp.]|nr:condensation domain-containing protein [Lysobacter sp.]